jgi:hypothetical protein
MENANLFLDTGPENSKRSVATGSSAAEGRDVPRGRPATASRPGPPRSGCAPSLPRILFTSLPKRTLFETHTFLGVLL